MLLPDRGRDQLPLRPNNQQQRSRYHVENNAQATCPVPLYIHFLFYFWLHVLLRGLFYEAQVLPLGNLSPTVPSSKGRFVQLTRNSTTLFCSMFYTFSLISPSLISQLNLCHLFTHIIYMCAFYSWIFFLLLSNRCIRLRLTYVCLEVSQNHGPVFKSLPNGRGPDSNACVLTSSLLYATQRRIEGC